jgi:SAM-dependent methyltransferase
MKRATAQEYLREIGRYRGAQGGRLLEIGCGKGEFLAEAQQFGYRVTGVEISKDAASRAQRLLGEHGEVICGTVEGILGATATFDVCVLSDVIEHVRQPLVFLQQIRSLLKPDGVIFIATPSLDSWSARVLQQNWMEFKPEHLSYFGINTLQNALYRSGFDRVITEPGWKTLNLTYIASHFERFPVPGITPLVQAITRLIPAPLRNQNFRVVASGMMAFARATKPIDQPRLSVILALYNEAATFPQLIESLLAKTIPGVDIEVVIVESNSTDGSRELALQDQQHPRVRLVLEERPRGKGHAVRTGFTHASGDFILIQDADLEYDLEDYDTLLEPLVEGRETFVLGSRHGGAAWKMRRFNDQRLLGLILNMAHYFFTGMLNLLFGLKLRDPQTMYKVFRRDALYGLRFESNRFDFDYELLIKLVRKGNRPIEIPVNYRSRSFNEGKKVSMFRDPLTWISVMLRMRVAKVDPVAELERQRRDIGTTE